MSQVISVLPLLVDIFMLEKPLAWEGTTAAAVSPASLCWCLVVYVCVCVCVCGCMYVWVGVVVLAWVLGCKKATEKHRNCSLAFPLCVSDNHGSPDGAYSAKGTTHTRTHTHTYMYMYRYIKREQARIGTQRLDEHDLEHTHTYAVQPHARTHTHTQREREREREDRQYTSVLRDGVGARLCDHDGTLLHVCALLEEATQWRNEVAFARAHPRIKRDR